MTLTEHEARELLATAADTIEVSSTPIPEPARRLWLVPVAAAAAMIGVVAGVALWHSSNADITTSPVVGPSASPPPPSSATPHSSVPPALQRLKVPTVVGLARDKADETLRNDGFGVETALAADYPAGPCRRGEYVTDQSPVGTLQSQGATVRITLSCADPVVAAGVPDALAESAQAFVSFADDGGEVPRWADRVSYTIGGEEVKVLDPEQASRRASWQGCPAAGAYAGAVCPFSPLSVIPHRGRSFVFGLSIAPPPTEPLNCMAWPDSYDPDPARAVAIRPTGPMVSCGGGSFVVTLFTDADGEVDRVDLMLAEP